MFGLKRKNTLDPDPKTMPRQYNLPEILDVIRDPGEALIVERFLRGDTELFETKADALRPEPPPSRVDVTWGKDAERTIVVVGQRKDNTGRSTTQDLETIASDWVNTQGLDPAKYPLVWFEFSAPLLPAPVAGLWQWRMEWEPLPAKYQRGWYDYPRYKHGSGHWTHLRTPKVPYAALLAHFDEVGKPDYAANLCELVEYMAAVAAKTCMYSSYRSYSGVRGVVKPSPDDAYALCDHIHNLGDLAQAIRNADVWAIIHACAEQMEGAVRIPAKQWPLLFDEILHEGTTPRLAEIIARIAAKAHAHLDALEAAVLAIDPNLRLTSTREYK